MDWSASNHALNSQLSVPLAVACSQQQNENLTPFKHQAFCCSRWVKTSPLSVFPDCENLTPGWHCSQNVQFWELSSLPTPLVGHLGVPTSLFHTSTRPRGDNLVYLSGGKIFSLRSSFSTPTSTSNNRVSWLCLQVSEVSMAAEKWY